MITSPINQTAICDHTFSDEKERDHSNQAYKTPSFFVIMPKGIKQSVITGVICDHRISQNIFTEEVMEDMEDALGALDDKMSMTMSRIEQRLDTLENMVR